MNETPLIVNLVILFASLIFVPILLFRDRRYFKSKLSIVLFMLLFLFFFFNFGCTEFIQTPEWRNKNLEDNCTCWEFTRRINLTNEFFVLSLGEGYDLGWQAFPYFIKITFGENKPYCNDANNDGDLLDNDTDYLSLRVIKDVKSTATGCDIVASSTGYWEVPFEINNPVCTNNQLYSGTLVLYPTTYKNTTDCGHGDGRASYLIAYSNESRFYPTFDLTYANATPILYESGNTWVSNYSNTHCDSLIFDKNKGYISEYHYGLGYFAQTAPSTGLLKIYNTSGYYIFSDDLQEIIHTGDTGGSPIDFSSNYTLHNVTLTEDATITEIKLPVAKKGTSAFDFYIHDSYCGDTPNACLSGAEATATLLSADVKNGTNYVDITDFSASEGDVLWIMTKIGAGGTEIEYWQGDNARTQEISEAGTAWIYQDTVTPSIRLVKSSSNDACSISVDSQLRKVWNCTSGNNEGWIRVSRELLVTTDTVAENYAPPFGYTRIETNLNQDYYVEIDSVVEDEWVDAGALVGKGGYATAYEYEGYTPITGGGGGLGDLKVCGYSANPTINEGWILESNGSAVTYIVWNESIANQFKIDVYCEYGTNGENYTKKIIGPVSANEDFLLVYSPMMNLTFLGVDIWRIIMRPPTRTFDSEQTFNCTPYCYWIGAANRSYCNYPNCLRYDQDLNQSYCVNTTTYVWMNNSQCCGDDIGEDWGDGILNCCCNGAFLAHTGRCDRNEDDTYDAYCDRGSYVCTYMFVDSNNNGVVDGSDACACSDTYAGYFCDSNLDKIFDGVCIGTTCCNTTAVDKDANGVPDFCGNCGAAGVSGVPCSDSLPTKTFGRKCDSTDNKCITCSEDGTEGFEYEDLICEFACGAVAECDEVQVGTKLGKCGLYGKTYFEDTCCGKDEDTSICRSSKFSSNCTADVNCEGLAPESCPSREYICSYACTYEDRDFLGTYCESTNPGCTAYTWVGSKCCGDDGVNDDYVFTDGICFNGEIYYCGTEDDTCPEDLNATCLTSDPDCIGEERLGLLDVTINLLKEAYTSGEELAFDIKLTAYGEEEIKAKIKYNVLRDLEVIGSEEESINVKNEISFSREIQLPEELEAGDYSLLINISYNDKELSESKKFYILLDCVDIFPKELYIIAETEQDIKLKVMNKCGFTLEDYTLTIPEFNNFTVHLDEIEISEDVWIRSSVLAEGEYSFNLSSFYKSGTSLIILNIISTASKEVISRVKAAFNEIEQTIRIARAGLATLFLFAEDRERYLDNINLVDELLELADDEIALKKYTEAQVTIAIAKEILGSIKQEVDKLVGRQNQTVLFGLIGVVVFLASVVAVKIYTMGRFKKPSEEEEEEIEEAEI